MLLSFYLMSINDPFSTVFYSISCLLDAIDGTLARAFNQSTKFGAVLDMVIDRSTTCGLILFISKLYPPKLTILFQFLIALDISSHYMIMYYSLLAKLSSHKQINTNQQSNYPSLLRIYYGSKLALFLTCLGNEAFLLSLLLIKIIPNYKISNNELKSKLINWIITISYLTVVPFLLKQLANILQLAYSSKGLMQLEQKEKEK